MTDVKELAKKYLELQNLETEDGVPASDHLIRDILLAFEAGYRRGFADATRRESPDTE